MRDQIALCQAIGKTIQFVGESWNEKTYLLAFTDNTFAVIEAENFCEEAQVNTNGAFCRYDYNDDVLAKCFGAEWMEQWLREREGRKAEMQAQQEAAERQLLAELKAKWEQV